MDSFEDRWKHVVFSKNISEEESQKFYETWAKTVINNFEIFLQIKIFIYDYFLKV